MGIVADIIIVVIILLSTVFAYKKGLVNLAISLCAFIIAIAVTFVFYKPISNFVINSTSIDEAIENGIYEKANSIMEENKTDDDLTSQIIETTQNNMLPETARNLAIDIVTGGTIIVLFVGLKIGLRFVTLFADLVTKLPIIKQFNKAGGILYGILEGALIIYIIIMVFTIIAPMINNMNILTYINGSFIGRIIL